MSAVLTWLKSNIASVIFFVVMIAALVALPIVAAGLNEDVRKTVKDRVNSHNDLRKLEKTSISIPRVSGPPIQENAIINKRLLDRYRAIVDAQRADAQQVRQLAVEHNRKGREVLEPRLFPEPRQEDREVLPERFWNLLLAAYEQLLDDVSAGTPPEPAVMAEYIERERSKYYSQILQKDLTDTLTADEEAELHKELAADRRRKYSQQAEDLRVYAGLDAFLLPVWEQANQPTMSELYDWQWQYWIVDDVLRGITDANDPASKVELEPVKRVLEITAFAPDFAPPSSGGGGGGGGGSPGFGGGGSPGFGGGAPRGGGGGDGAAGPAPAPVNPSQEVKLDYGVSFTGRVTNPLYDVRLVQARLVVETARIGDVLDSLAKRNFITILDLQMLPADHYAAAQAGYYYGGEPVTELNLVLETVWLREWTVPFMPPEMRQALRIPDPAAAPSG